MISQTSGLLSQVLDINALQDNLEDAKVALLRRVEFKRTVDDVPFLRMTFSDINGQSIIGRMFNLEKFEEIGNAVQALTGRLVLIKFVCESREQGLRCNQVQRINEQTEQTLQELISDSRTSRFQSIWDDFAETLISLGIMADKSEVAQYSSFRDFSHESIYNGRAGGICDVLKWTCMSAIAASVPASTLHTFIAVVHTWILNQGSGETRVDLSKISFVSAAVTLLPNTGSQAEIMREYQLVSEFVSLFLGIAELRNANTELVWMLYKAYSKFTTVQALGASVPKGGIFVQNGVTYRK